MKKSTIFLAAACAATLCAGCGGDDGGKKGGDGTNEGWMLASWNGGTALAGKVFLELNDDDTFVLYQCIETQDFRRFTGTYRITPGAETTPASEYDLLSGTYSDGKPWASGYRIRAKNDRSMTLVEEGGSEAVSVYERVKIPDYVKVPGPKITGYAPGAEEKPFL